MNKNTLFEIERKYLIEMPDAELLNSKASSKTDIIQTYLVSGKNRVRIRSLLENGEYKYIKTIKKSVTTIRRIEIESTLTQEEYLTLLGSTSQKKQLSKTRYVLPYENQNFEIDIYPFWQDKAIMEIELDDENDKIVFPDFINIIREVTEEKEYRNFALAKEL